MRNPPTDAPIDEVAAVLKRHFHGKYVAKAGSHYVVRDQRLAAFSGFAPLGEFSVPVKGGQRVKGHYLKRLARAIQIIEELERAEDEEP